MQGSALSRRKRGVSAALMGATLSFSLAAATVGFANEASKDPVDAVKDRKSVV